MIRINFSLRWPKKFSTEGRDYFYKEWILTKNKSFEIQITNWNKGDIFDIGFDWTMRRDHAGVMFSLTILDYGIILNFYDIRHWNYDTGRWQTKEEAEEEYREWMENKKESEVS